MRRLDFMMHLSDRVNGVIAGCDDPGIGNFFANMLFNAGSWNGWTIYTVTVDDVKWYCADCCRNASTDISTIRRVCGRN